MRKTIVLEPSTNTHTITEVISAENITESIVKVKTTRESKVIHGEHGTIGIESENVVKYVQQELNPLTKKFQNNWD